MEGPFHDVMAMVMGALTGQKINYPGAYESYDGEKCVRCSYKASDGFLFPLEKCIFFVHKPPLYIRHDEINSVEFLRVSGASSAGASRTFDLIVNTETHHMFASFNRDEYANLRQYFADKKIYILNVDQTDAEAGAQTRSGRVSRKGGDSEDVTGKLSLAVPHV